MIRIVVTITTSMMIQIVSTLSKATQNHHHHHDNHHNDPLVKSDPLLLQSPPLWQPITLARLWEPEDNEQSDGDRYHDDHGDGNDFKINLAMVLWRIPPPPFHLWAKPPEPEKIPLFKTKEMFL